MVGGPAAALYGITDSGWMDAANFLSWFVKLFLPAVLPMTGTAPVAQFLDGHHSHISLELIRKARDNNILLLCLPPNTTHLLQPLDVGVFAPLKNAWKVILKRHKLETRGANVNKEIFPHLLSELWETSFTPQHCKGGFRGAGLVPFSPEHVLAKLSPSSEPSNSSNDERGGRRKVACSSCGHDVATTPIIKTHIVSYFAGILEVRKDRPKIGARNHLKVRVEGEAITSDEFLELLQEQRDKKESEKAKKGKRNRATQRRKATTEDTEPPEDTHDVDENTCQVCGIHFDDDDHQEAWIGCDSDNCGRWFHYWCAGFDRKPSSRKKFLCGFC
jgi:hypothetical protein